MERTKYQKFEYREVHRNQIKEAPYNPNVMAEEVQASLRKRLQSTGLIETLIWNETTGNLVGGHHRLQSIDALEKSKDYTLGVSVVKLSPKREREMNIFLNNSQAQGNFDKDKFFAMLAGEPDLQLSDIGLTRLDLEMDFGDLPDLANLNVLGSREKEEAKPAAAPISVPATNNTPQAIPRNDTVGPIAAVAPAPAAVPPIAPEAKSAVPPVIAPAPSRAPLPTLDPVEDDEDLDEDDEDDALDGEEEQEERDRVGIPVRPPSLNPTPLGTHTAQSQTPSLSGSDILAAIPSEFQAPVAPAPPMSASTDGDCYLLVTFDSMEEKAEFLRTRRFPLGTEQLTPAEAGLNY